MFETTDLKDKEKIFICAKTKIKIKPMKEFKTSLFYDKEKGIFNPEPIKEITLAKLFDIYQSKWLKKECEFLDITRQVLPMEYKHDKLKLPMFTPYGTFKPKRSNDNLDHYNSEILALDIDAVKNPNEIKEHLSNMDGCVLCVISPSKNGVKALFRISKNIHQTHHFARLNENSLKICQKLNIDLLNVDTAQFKLSQGMLISYDKTGYFNDNPRPLVIDLPYEPPIYEPPQIKVDVGLSKSRIERYIRHKTGNILDTISQAHKGTRHGSIFEISKIKSDLFYLPEIENDIYKVCSYGLNRIFESDGETRQKDAQRYLDHIWMNAKEIKNDTIENIIKELQNG